MKINKIKNLSKNMFFGLLYRFISLLFPFIIRTVMINVLSSEYLGLSSLFTSILQALNLVELGLGSALVFNMYEPIANNNVEKIKQYLAYYKKCYRIIGLCILIIGLILMPFLEYFINGTYPENINIYILYFIYLINTVLTYWLFAYKNSVALAYQRTDIESKISTINHIILYICQIIILLVFKNYYLYVILLPLFTIIKNIMISYKIDKTYPEIKAEGELSKEEKDKVKDNVKSLFGHQIAFTVINSADNIVISALLGLNDLAIYNNYYYILNAIINIFSIFFSSIQAGLGNSIIVDKKEEVFNKYKKFRLFNYSLVYICSLCFYTLFQPFMKMWMGEKMMLNSIGVLIFVIGFYITQVRRTVTTYKNAAGLWKNDFFKPYIVIIVDIILDFIFIPLIGSVGAMLATAISMLLIAIPWENHVLYKYLFNENIKEQYRFVFKEVIMFIISLILIEFVIKFIPSLGILELLIKLIVSVIIGIIMICIFHYKDENLKWIKDRVIFYVKNKQ